MIPVTDVRCGLEEEALVLEVLRSGNLARVRWWPAWRVLFPELAGTRHAVAVNNGTNALVAPSRPSDRSRATRWSRARSRSSPP